MRVAPNPLHRDPNQLPNLGGIEISRMVPEGKVLTSGSDKEFYDREKGSIQRGYAEELLRRGFPAEPSYVLYILLLVKSQFRRSAETTLDRVGSIKNIAEPTIEAVITKTERLHQQLTQAQAAGVSFPFEANGNSTSWLHFRCGLLFKNPSSIPKLYVTFYNPEKDFCTETLKKIFEALSSSGLSLKVKIPTRSGQVKYLVDNIVVHAQHEADIVKASKILDSVLSDTDYEISFGVDSQEDSYTGRLSKWLALALQSGSGNDQDS